MAEAAFLGPVDGDGGPGLALPAAQPRPAIASSNKASNSSGSGRQYLERHLAELARPSGRAAEVGAAAGIEAGGGVLPALVEGDGRSGRRRPNGHPALAPERPRAAPGSAADPTGIRSSLQRAPVADDRLGEEPGGFRVAAERVVGLAHLVGADHRPAGETARLAAQGEQGGDVVALADVEDLDVGVGEQGAGERGRESDGSASAATPSPRAAARRGPAPPPRKSGRRAKRTRRPPPPSGRRPGGGQARPWPRTIPASSRWL